jgi:cytochrome b561
LEDLPIVPGLAVKGLHDVFTEVHEIAFNALLIALMVHVLFHISRHYMIKGNALGIMAPKALHRYL